MDADRPHVPYFLRMRSIATGQWWLTIFPGVCISVVVLAANVSAAPRERGKDKGPVIARLLRRLQRRSRPGGRRCTRASPARAATP